MEFMNDFAENIMLEDNENIISAVPYCSDKIPFVSTYSVPNGFNVDIMPGLQRIDYCSCLTCRVETKRPLKDIDIFMPKLSNNNASKEKCRVNLIPVRIVGGIQYIVEAKCLRGHCELFGSTADSAVFPKPNVKGISISCTGSLCVNQIICYIVDNGRVKGRCLDIKTSSLKVCFNSIEPKQNLIIFKGFFILPKSCCSPGPHPTPFPTPHPTFCP